MFEPVQIFDESRPGSMLTNEVAISAMHWGKTLPDRPLSAVPLKWLSEGFGDGDYLISRFRPETGFVTELRRDPHDGGLPIRVVLDSPGNLFAIGISLAAFAKKIADDPGFVERSIRLAITPAAGAA